ncbi:matrixin family metalloprotease [Actinomadura sp. WAC 06369]|uniref:matrixin family metalloprotease n=1 Tax=Actinomadura sp. WAC 06369 TaxID=2203193 RepID=UPI000F76DA24|nr:matrixin family metalloprotease [Actinomadura sp. WAC 06369]RSN45396.1 hypothetical protein DMH08_36675 [Actinomadura sp. WAC 06369]
MDDFPPAPRRRRAMPTIGRSAERTGTGPAARRPRAALVAAALSAAAVAAAGLPGTASATADAAPPWCAGKGPLAARMLPTTIDIAECDLRGRVVTGAGGLSATVPRDGTSVAAHWLRTDGAAELRIQFDDRTNRIVIRTGGMRAPQGRPRGARAPQDACTDGRYRTQPSKWPKGTTVQWRYHTGGTGRASTTVARGVSNAVDAHTDCRSDGQFNPLPNVSARYLGASAQPPNLTSAAACGRRDGVNTFGWLAMAAAEGNVLAATCSWSSGPTTVETDMALQTQGRRWWTGAGSCPQGAFSTTAVATHETGHVLGLSHVSGAGGSNLTMAPRLGPCDNGPSTLGKGDYDGLIALYGAR